MTLTNVFAGNFHDNGSISLQQKIATTENDLGYPIEELAGFVHSIRKHAVVGIIATNFLTHQF